MVVYFHLADPGTFDEGQGRQEAVEFAVEVEVTHHLAPISLEGAAVVVESHPSYPGNQAVGDAAGQQPLHGRILALVAPAAYQVEALVELS